MVLMRVSELAERSGVAATTLRYYEERGLLPAQRPPAGYRLYDERVLHQLHRPAPDSPAGQVARLLGALGPDPVKEH